MNKIWMRVLILLVLFAGAAQAQDPKSALLDSFHQAASDADFDGYFSLLSENSVFLGTDGEERWTKEEFMAYVKPHFERGNGWTYVASDRHVTSTAAKDVYIFDEKLFNENYGYCRGTGVLVKTQKGLKIAQYNLSIPLPNAIADEVVEQVLTHMKNKALEKPISSIKKETDVTHGK